MKDKILRVESIGGELYEVVEETPMGSCSKCDIDPASGLCETEAEGKCIGGYLRKVKPGINWTGLFRQAVVFFQGFLFALVCTQDREFAAYCALVLAAVTAAKIVGRN